MTTAETMTTGVTAPSAPPPTRLDDLADPSLLADTETLLAGVEGLLGHTARVARARPATGWTRPRTPAVSTRPTGSPPGLRTLLRPSLPRRRS